ncbi:DEAD/DEAH box helicase [Tepidibacillus sp. HK-1]|uniref:DEAD/DEAH box helicase n=1 Tax=Tepidibacillus sp. HK-1 TaxID=1883407 RepID=UPI000853335D|nr:DEAD/DEAH box helicase [Tepidibacillus sp. HK-1]GBF11363.1 ATP-dependent helicase HepA [Tepidibacillus sp. HK-1]
MTPTASILSKETIKQMFNHTAYERGLTYFKQGRVKTLYYEPKDECWVGNVLGNDTYYVTVELHDHYIDSSCDCLAYEQFGQCKHEVAVLLEMVRHREQIENVHLKENPIRKRDNEQTTRFIETFSQRQYTEIRNTNSAKDQLMVEYILKAKSHYPYYSENYLTIEMKTGLNRTYVVKNIKDFLRASDHESYVFTANFSYEPAEHAFSKEDEEILKILRAIAKNEQLYLDASPYQRHTSYTESREMIIPPIVVDELLLKLKDRETRFEYPPHSVPTIDVCNEEELPFSFELQKGKEEDFELKLNDITSAILFEPYGYLYFKGTFYKLSAIQQKLMKDFFSLMKNKRDSSLLISKDQIEPFLSNVTPALEEIGTLTIDETISDQILAPDLKTKIWIDYNQDILNVNLEYQYGDRILNPFLLETTETTENQETILIRDIVKEQEIMSILEGAPLKYNGKELYLVGEDDLYQFLYHTLPLLEDKAEIYLTRSARLLMIPEQQKPVVSIDLDSSGDWLDVRFDISGIDQQDVQNILQSVIEKKRYYRLHNGTFVPIDDDDFATIHQLIDELDISKSELQKGEIKRPLFKGMLIDDIVSSSRDSSIRFGKTFRHFIKNFKNPDQLDFDIPQSLQASLRDYQNFGFQWMKTLSHYRLGGILADDMGLGKTIQAITFMTSEKKEKKELQPMLVVAPASLIYNWKNEFQKFSPELKVRIIDGNPEERKELIQFSNEIDVWITSYPMLRQDIDLYKKKQFSVFIIDEAQAMKNPTTKIFKAVQEIQASQRFALSGTPIENSIDELWAIFQVILPGFFPNKSAFKSIAPEKISKMVRPFILRRVKKDVLKELPDKIETVQVSELTKQQKELYLGYLEKIRNETKASIQSGGFNKDRIKILAGLTRLRQICNHPGLFLENYTGESGKLEQLIELVETSLENGNRLLIFSQFSSMLQIIGQRLQETGLDYFYLDGQTPGKERVLMADDFNRGEKEIFLISLKAGGTGLNLTGADTVILFDLWWNPAVEEQATGRAHRMGQKKIVQVMRLITSGTIEEKIYELQQRKKELVEKVIQTGEQMITSLTKEELQEILEI